GTTTFSTTTSSTTTTSTTTTTLCNSYGLFCVYSDRGGIGTVCEGECSLIGVVLTYDGIVSNSGFGGCASLGQPRDINTFNEWCPFSAYPPGTPPIDCNQDSSPLIGPLCGSHTVTLTVSQLPGVGCGHCGPPQWPVTIYLVGEDGKFALPGTVFAISTF